jgi:sugar lactone lactonase YvrE
MPSKAAAAAKPTNSGNGLIRPNSNVKGQYTTVRERKLMACSEQSQIATRVGKTHKARLLATLLSFPLWGPSCTGQSVTFGGPVVGGEATTQVGAITSSSPLLNIVSPGGIATNKLGTYYITDQTGNAVYSFVPGTSQNTPTYIKLKFSSLSSPSGIAVDASGNVFVVDRNNSRVVELPADGGAQVVVASGVAVTSGIAVDTSGHIYVSVAGTTYLDPGGVIKITEGNPNPSPIGSGFNIPLGLALDSAGNLFVADSQDGRIVEIASDGSQTTVVSGLNVPTIVAVDSADNLFTDGDPGGYVIEIRAGSSEQVAVVPAILGIYTGIAVDGNDNLFAVSAPTAAFTESNTEVISLPSANVCQLGGTPSTSCSSSIALTFWIWNSVNLGQPRILTQGTQGLDFTDGGSSQNSLMQGIAQPCIAGPISLIPHASETCSVTVKFAPLAAGPRRGAVQIVDSDGNVLVQLMLYAVGNGPQISIAAKGAATITSPITVSAEFLDLDAVAVDAAGNVFVSTDLDLTNSNTSSIYKISPSGVETTIPISNIFSPGRVEIDGSGNLVLPGGFGAYSFPPGGSVSSTPPTTMVSGLHGITEGLALDGLGDADIVADSDGSPASIVYRATLDGSLIAVASSTSTLGDIIHDPWIMFADTGGHYDGPIAAAGANLELISPLEESVLPYLDLQTLNSNFVVNMDSGTLGVSPGGDIYFTNGLAIFDTKGRTVFPIQQGVSGPFAVDQDGNFFIIIPSSGGGGGTLLKMPAIQQPFNFVSTAVGSSSAAQEFTVFNSGNAPMSFSAISASVPFAIDPSGTSCSVVNPVSVSSSCTIVVEFTPTANGAATGNLSVSVVGLATPAFMLAGTGQSALITTATVVTASPNPASFGATVTLGATVSSASSSPTGSVSFYDGTMLIGTASLSANTASYAASTLAVGTHSITAHYTGDSNNAANVSSPVELTIAPISVQVTPGVTTIAPGGSITANVVVGSAANYTGTVSLTCTVVYQGEGAAANTPGCEVAPATVTLSAGGTQAATLTITTFAQSAKLQNRVEGKIVACGLGFGGMVLFVLLHLRNRGAGIMAFVLLALTIATGCNQTPPPPPAPVTTPGTTAGTYVVTLSSVAESVTTTQTLSITVQ